jgi:ethanolamine ammonia-lyase small subunit
VVVADGLSARAAQNHALPLILALAPRLQAEGICLDRVLLAHQARVALGDEVGGLLRAQALLMLIGERPGLSSPDSLGAYITWAPQPARSDAQRNCVSNIRPEGLSYAQAAHKIAWLLAAARRLGGSGVALKDDSDVAVLPAQDATQLSA